MALNEDAVRRLYMECQVKLQQFSRDLNAVKLQIAQKDRDRRIHDLVQQELAGLGAGKRTYKSVGKMFLAAEPTDISKDLKVESKSLAKESEALGKKKEFIERSSNDIQNLLRDVTRGR
ncbi:hypothetical protein M427DRAFT_50382 [Gonapodya prolifera JEL478]|uniref:Prefoldin n=1 Tax=Gonapodya prolifera (strain JEL478) TaxID=1344416 RepID=A0A139AZ63_GONPJ|nr:hypothetical protein M427DRAFT_50382 [Gonapodya prolifera JEL478]|eukprot:KXS22021.1 hypothetical protein M427DRAFT_50382 [Gonapodya prolifera JEL478]